MKWNHSFLIINCFLILIVSVSVCSANTLQKTANGKKGAGRRRKDKGDWKSVNVCAVAKWLQWHQRILIGCFTVTDIRFVQSNFKVALKRPRPLCKQAHFLDES